MPRANHTDRCSTPPPSRRYSLRAAWLLAVLTTAPAPTLAGVLQVVDTRFVPPGGPEVSARDLVFELASGDIDRDILAVTGSPPAGGPGYHAISSAGRFGQLGLQADFYSSAPGSVLQSEVLIASDEFVNVASGPAAIRSNFIIDGGSFRDFFSTSTIITFRLAVGAEPIGFEDAATGPLGLEIDGGITARFGASGLVPGGGYELIIATDASGARTVVTHGSNTLDPANPLDLGAEVDPVTGAILIPSSLQSLDLGILGAGERLRIGYWASITIESDGITEGIFTEFSDPLSLSGTPFLSSISLTAVPVPASVLLLASGLPLLDRQCLRRRPRIGPDRCRLASNLATGEFQEPGR